MTGSDKQVLRFMDSGLNYIGIVCISIFVYILHENYDALACVLNRVLETLHTYLPMAIQLIFVLKFHHTCLGFNSRWTGMVQVLIHLPGWFGLGSAACGFVLDWILSKEPVSYPGSKSFA